MSNLRERTRAASLAAVRWDTVTTLGNAYRIRGMMQGERLRVAQAQEKGGVERAIPLMFALCVYDPETNRPLWNGNAAEDVEQINALPGEAADTFQAAILRLSGMDDAEGNLLQPGTSTSPSASSASGLVGAPSPSLGVG